MRRIGKKKLIFLLAPLILILWFLNWWFEPLQRIAYEVKYEVKIKAISSELRSKYDDLIYIGLYRYKRRLEADTSIQGIRFPKGSEIRFSYPSERIEDIELPETVKKIEIQGIKCCSKYGGIEFYLSGKLKHTYLAENQTIQGINIPKGLGIYLYKSGKLKGIQLAVGIFYEDGKRKYFQDETLQIQGIKWGRGVLSGDNGDVEFYESGSVKYGTLAEAQEIQGIKFPKGTGIEFYESGKLKSAILPEAVEVQGIKCTKGWGVRIEGDIEFYESGKIKYIHRLAEDQEIQGIKCYKGNEVHFDEKGNIIRFEGSLEEDTVIQGINIPKGSTVFFYSSGKIDIIMPSKQLEIEGMKIPAWSTIFFYESGELKALKLSKTTRIKGKRYPACGEYTCKILVFDEHGDIIPVDFFTRTCRLIIKKRER